MPARVVDASAIGALLFGEPAAEKIAGALEGMELSAPTLLPYEIASVCAKKIAAHPGRERQIMDTLALLPALNVKLYVVPPPEAVTMARARKLTVYDAAYLWLTAELGADLITLDEALARAWKRHRAISR